MNTEEERIQLKCSGCGKVIVAPATMAGKKGRDKECSGRTYSAALLGHFDTYAREMKKVALPEIRNSRDTKEHICNLSRASYQKSDHVLEEYGREGNHKKHHNLKHCEKG